MIKKHYEKEIQISGVQANGSANNNKEDVMKIQSWLNLFARTNPASGTSTAIDSAFGAVTEAAVKTIKRRRTNLKPVRYALWPVSQLFDGSPY